MVEYPLSKSDKPLPGIRVLQGRRVIETPVEVIDRSNIMEQLQLALNVHHINQSDIDYLHKYRLGKQPILDRIKPIRPEIKNIILENHATEIIDFKKGHVFGEPIQYVRRGDDEALSEAISDLNEYMYEENKLNQDQSLADWMLTCGTGYRMILPDKAVTLEEDDSPFEMETLDPRFAFVVYNNGFGHKPVMAVKFVQVEGNQTLYSIYTPTHYCEVKADQLMVYRPHALGDIPIIEYPANPQRMGAFEPVVPLLDAINTIASNRVDGVEQFVQSFIKFVNCDIDEEQFKAMKELGAIKLRSDNQLPADVEIITSELNQTQVQSVKDDLYQMVLIICGMPDRNGTSRANGDTGAAVQLRDGWTAAETKAKELESMFKESERKFLKLALRIVRDTAGTNLRLKDIEIKFTRSKNDNIMTKSQSLQNLLEAGIHPRVAINTVGLFSDPEQVYLDSKEILEKWTLNVEQQKDSLESSKKAQELIGKEPTTETDRDAKQTEKKNAKENDSSTKGFADKKKIKE